ncbi:MAG: hypothetical protein AABZ13_09230, partial [Planctomycetota bacterium]
RTIKSRRDGCKRQIVSRPYGTKNPGIQSHRDKKTRSADFQPAGVLTCRLKACATLANPRKSAANAWHVRAKHLHY